MGFEFKNERTLGEIKLTELRKQQFAVLDREYFQEVAETTVLELHKACTNEQIEAPFWANSTSLWDVRDGDTLLLEAYMYGADSGTIFHAGTDTVAGELVQRRLQAYDTETEAALWDAFYDSEELNHARNFTMRDG